jgi:IPT/TIG domain
MRISAVMFLFLAALAPVAWPQAEVPLPTMRSVEPVSGKAGDVLVVEGINLGRENVAALYLTDEKTDVKVSILDQAATSIRFRIPPEAKPGRLTLMVLTTGRDPKYIEEPVKITVEPGSLT